MTEPTYTPPPETAPEKQGNNRLLWILIVGAIALVVVLVIALLVSDDDDGSSTATDGGATAEEITAGQEALQAVGCYTGPVDGVYGPGTEQAIRDFQAASGLQVDGIFGPATRDALEEAVAQGETVCTGDGGDGELKTARLTTSDGLDQTLDVKSCSYVSESDFELTAETETSNIAVAVSESESSVVYQSADGNREGDVDSVSGTDTVTVKGSLSIADDSAEPATFELVADCT